MQEEDECEDAVAISSGGRELEDESLGTRVGVLDSRGDEELVPLVLSDASKQRLPAQPIDSLQTVFPLAVAEGTVPLIGTENGGLIALGDLVEFGFGGGTVEGFLDAGEDVADGDAVWVLDGDDPWEEGREELDATEGGFGGDGGELGGDGSRGRESGDEGL